MTLSNQESSSDPQGLAKAALVEECNRRLERALKSGAYIEALSLLDVLINDHLSSLISLVNRMPVKPDILGRQISRVDRLKILEPRFMSDLWIWSSRREKSVQNLIQVNGEVSLDWNARIRFVRETATQGYELLVQLEERAANMKQNRGYRKLA